MKTAAAAGEAEFYLEPMIVTAARYDNSAGCLLYTSDAADE